MSEEELREFMEALAKRDLRPGDMGHLNFAIYAKARMKQIADTAKLAYTIADRPERTEMYSALAIELEGKQQRDNPVAFLASVFDQTGISDALDENLDIIRNNLKRGHVPPEDVEFLRMCGVTEPEAEITIAIQRMKQRWFYLEHNGQFVGATETLRMAQVTLREQVKRLAPVTAEGQVEAPKKKPRKIFNGIGKMLSGVVAGTGNALMGCGVIPASGGAMGAAVIASAAVSISLVMQGIGDLRGE